MLLLALDTASATVSVALHDGTTVIAERAGTPSPRHAELLTPMVGDVLAAVGASMGDLTSIAVGVGPGPFTGLRVGLVTARMLGFALDVDVAGICSLDAVAAGAVAVAVAGDGLRPPPAAEPHGGAPVEFVAAIDARRREVYWATYLAVVGGPPERLDGPHVGAPADVPRAGAPVVGRGGELYPDLLGPARAPLDPPAASIAALAVHGAPYLLPPEPLYLRRPDAALPGARKRVTP